MVRSKMISEHECSMHRKDGKSIQNVCEISGSHGGEYEDDVFLEYSAV
jgi:hypothetical protein